VYEAHAWRRIEGFEPKAAEAFQLLSKVGVKVKVVRVHLHPAENVQNTVEAYKFDSKGCMRGGCAAHRAAPRLR
jgi:hypothetical protein